MPKSLAKGVRYRGQGEGSLENFSLYPEDKKLPLPQLMQCSISHHLKQSFAPWNLFRPFNTMSGYGPAHADKYLLWEPCLSASETG